MSGADTIRTKLKEAVSALCAAQYVDNKEIKQDGFDAARRLITESLAELSEMERDHEANKKTVCELMIPIEALLMAYPEKGAKPIGLTQGIWDAIRKHMPGVRVAVLGMEDERKAVMCILGSKESPSG